MKRKKLLALVLAATLVVISVLSQVGLGWAYFEEGMNPTEWVKLLLDVLEPLLGAEACALIAAFIYAFLGKWANHQAWDWKKFEQTFKVAIVNGILFTILNIAAGWSFAKVEVWVTQIAGLYIMQKFLEAIGPYFAPLFGKQE